MHIKDARTKENYEVIIKPVTTTEIKSLSGSNQFVFDWYSTIGCEVLKLTRVDSTEILGLMHIEDHPEPGHDYLEIKLLEVSSDNRENEKRYENIAGCLIAFACRISVVRGHGGFIMLISKTQTAAIYAEKYGFINIGSIGTIGQRMISDERNARILIKKYLETL